MQRMRPDVPPETIQAHLLTRRFRAGDFEDAGSNAQARVCCHDLDACDPLSQLASLPRCELAARGQIA